MRLTTIIYGILIIIPSFISAKQIELFSPDGKNQIKVETEKKVTYSVLRNGHSILAQSPLTMTVGKKVWGEDQKPQKIERKSIQKEITFDVPRKFKTGKDNYNELILKYKDYNVEFRAYNDGVAYRFVSTSENISSVNSETVQFKFNNNYVSYTLLTNKLQNWYEESYTIKPINSLPRDSFSIAPVMVEVRDYKVLLAEANLYHYAGMYLKPTEKGFEGVFANYPKREEKYEGENKCYVVEREDYIIPKSGKRAFPWRVVGIFDKATDILNSELVYMLSDEKSNDADYSWIKPGKILWDWWNDRNIYGVDFVSGINTDTYIYMIDYAAKHGIEYILIDEGWSQNNNLLDLNPNVDMPRICEHGKAKGVGVQLWSKWVDMDRQMDAAFSQFSKWGVKGVKIDFMDRNDAVMVDFYERVAIEAAKYKMLVDFHGSYPNEGMRRKHPNLMTREGLIGLEYNKWSERATVKHDVIIPYLRMWVGPMDYTPGAMLNTHAETFAISAREPMSQGTRSHQLAMYVIYESPLQMISDSPSKYDENMESFNFIKKIPAVWDDIVPLAGEMGEYIILARRSGNTWYIGGLNADTERDIVLDLSFIGTGKLQINEHADGINSFQQAKDYKISEREIRDNKLTIKMTKGGGYVAIVNAI